MSNDSVSSMQHNGGKFAPSKWTDERARMLRDLWNDHSISATVIAAQLGGGITRNAVIGRAHRDNLPPRGSNPRAHVKVKPWTSLGISERTYRRRLKHGQELSAGFRAVRHPLPPYQPLSKDPQTETEAIAACFIDGLRVEFLDIQDNACRWPVSERPPHVFCAKPKQHRNLPYCACHCRVAYNYTPGRFAFGRAA